jgi:arylsulfatase A-like enzyme
MGKQSCYEHSVRVPLVLAGPGVPRGERRDALCLLTDVYPTICDLAGLDTPPSVEGLSLAPVLRDRAARPRERVHLAYRDLHRAVRDRRWKLIEYLVDGARTSQLFDLAEDPWETRNLAPEPALAGRLREMRRELLAWRDELGDPGAAALWSEIEALA